MSLILLLSNFLICSLLFSSHSLEYSFDVSLNKINTAIGAFKYTHSPSILISNGNGSGNGNNNNNSNGNSNGNNGGKGVPDARKNGQTSRRSWM